MLEASSPMLPPPKWIAFLPDMLQMLLRKVFNLGVYEAGKVLNVRLSV